MAAIQKCPVCDGQGYLNKPPWIAGDQTSWSAATVQTYECHRCGGLGTIESRETGTGRKQ